MRTDQSRSSQNLGRASHSSSGDVRKRASIEKKITKE